MIGTVFAVHNIVIGAHHVPFKGLNVAKTWNWSSEPSWGKADGETAGFFLCIVSIPLKI